MKKHGKSGMLLLELLLALLIFSVCAGICVLIFAKTASLSAQSRDLDNSVILAQNAAESIKSGSIQAENQTQYFSKELVATEQSGSDYRVTITAGEKTQNVQFFHIAVYREAGSELIYEIESAVLTD